MALGFTVLSTLGESRAHAQAMIVEFSDNHSAYQNLPTFLRSFDHWKAEFEKRHPGAPVVLIVNGDFAGLSEWSDADQGWLGIQALATIAKSTHVVYVLGNHDGFDLGVIDRGNILVERQIKYLQENGVHILGGNIDFTDRTRKWVEPHFDVLSASGRKMRFVGYGLEDLKDKSDWKPDVKPKIFTGISDTVAALKLDYAKASTAGIHDLIVFQHDYYDKLGPRIQTLLDHLGPLTNTKIPVAFAGHDHKKYAGKVGDTFLYDSGSGYEYSIVELNAEGKVVRHQQMDRATQSFLIRGKAKDPRLGQLAKDVESWLDRQIVKMNKVVGFTSGFHETKLVNKQGRTEIGTQLAEALVHWAEKHVQGSKLAPFPVVALYNSSSYRRDEPIPAGELTMAVYKSFYPMPGEAKLFMATGREIQDIFRAIRVRRETDDGNYTPQISRRLIEKDSKQLYFDGKPIDAEKTYYLALDPWLSRNGNNLPELDTFLATRDAKAKAKLLDIFMEHGMKVFAGTETIPVKPACMAFR